jgi:hypothetical protein
VRHGRHVRQASRRGRADIRLVVDDQIRRGVLQQRTQVLERATGQHVAEDDGPEAPPLLARQRIQPGVLAQGEPVSLVDRYADALGPDPQFPQPRAKSLSRGERTRCPASRHAVASGRSG